MTLRFLLDGEVVTVADAAATDTLLEYLRTRLGRIGAKEGCAEGDCGACTVLVGTLEQDQVAWRAVNACILLLPMLHGKALVTVESLSAGGALSPLQACMAANGSSQCGFCTPGFVMSLHGRAIGAAGCELPVADVIAGNLCRCTGYGPILAAGEQFPPVVQDDGAIVAALRGLAGDETVVGDGWFIPRDLDGLAGLLAEMPAARLVAGATDVGLWVTKRLQDLGPAIFVADVDGLGGIAEDDAGLRLGAAVRYADAHAALARLHPHLGELVRRIGGLQVRNAGTVGGNIANGSPIGDGPPALIALGAEVTLCSAGGRRTMPLEDFFIAYGRQDLAPGEFVESVWVPRPGPKDLVHMSKLSRRFDSDISAVCGAFRLGMDGARIVSARVAFGGMAGTPRRASGCEAALTGQTLNEATLTRAAEALDADYTPLSDVRGSAAYRRQAARGLLWRMWHAWRGEPVSVLDHG